MAFLDPDPWEPPLVEAGQRAWDGERPVPYKAWAGAWFPWPAPAPAGQGAAGPGGSFSGLAPGHTPAKCPGMPVSSCPPSPAVAQPCAVRHAHVAGAPFWVPGRTWAPGSRGHSGTPKNPLD